MCKVNYLDYRKKLVEETTLRDLLKHNEKHEMVPPNYYYQLPSLNYTLAFSMAGLRGHRRRPLMEVVIKAIQKVFSDPITVVQENVEIELYTYGHSIDIKIGKRQEEKVVLSLNGDLLSDKPKLESMLVEAYKKIMSVRAANKPKSPYEFLKDRADKGLEVIPERIVCAACLLESGTIILGARHWDTQMHMTMAAINPMDDGEAAARAEQGFYTNWHRFVDRKEAMIIARRENQITRPNGTHNPDVLYSECLY